MYNEHDSQTSCYKITPDWLTCHKNQLIHLVLEFPTSQEFVKEIH